MGMYNKIKSTMPNVRLLNGQCAICGNAGIKPVIGNPAVDCYDYQCTYCAPFKTISISGSALFSSLLVDVPLKDDIRIMIMMDIKYSSGDWYELGEGDLEFFSGRRYLIDISCVNTYDMWMKGQLPGIIDKYVKVDQVNFERIKAKQDSIFDERVNMAMSEFGEKYLAAHAHSIDPNALAKQEHDIIMGILSGSISIDHDNTAKRSVLYDTLIARGVHRVDHIYNKALKGKRIKGCIQAQAQKKYLGYFNQLTQEAICAIALTNYKNILSKADYIILDNTEEYLTEYELGRVDQYLEDIMRNEREKAEVDVDLNSRLMRLEEEIERIKTGARRIRRNEFVKWFAGQILSLGIEKLLSMNIVSKIIGYLMKRADFSGLPELLGI